jgi:cyclase
MLQAVCDTVKIPVIASGGAGSVQDFITLFKTVPGVDAGLAASVFHFGEIKIPSLKAELAEQGIIVRK